tara:strand:- start:569 stop:1363 length:795 start_codon:yes stop_codon:yes gene_type:complete
MNTKPNRNRNYIIYLLFFFLSGSVFLVDLFSNKKFSNIISDRVDFLFPVNQETINFLGPLDANIFKTRNDLVNENARLKNEVIELRKLKITNEKLVDEIKSNNELIRNVEIQNIIFYKSSILMKNTEDKFLIAGGRNINASRDDLILNQEGFVVGYITKVFDDHSLINTIINNDFSIPGIDKYGNEYLITSNREELIVNSISIEEMNSNIGYISTDIIFDQIAKFPIVSLSSSAVSTANNKISSQIEINYNFNFDSSIYIVMQK